MLNRRLALLITPALAAGAAVAPIAGAAPGGPKTVTISGTAYQFGSVHTMLAGATVHVLQEPSAQA